MIGGAKLLSLVKGVKDFQGVQKALQEIEDSINGLSESTNVASEGEVTDIEGKTGDIRITQNEDKDYIFEVRAEDGWKTPVIGDTAVKFKEKPSSSAAEKKESIDEIESKDASTDDKAAEKTIFDEKAGKFVIARPDYRSDWIRVVYASFTYNSGTNTPLTFTHNLEVLPSLVVFQFAPDEYNSNITSLAHETVVPESSIDYFMNMDFGNISATSGGQTRQGVTAIISKTLIYAKCGNSSIARIPTNLEGAATAGAVGEGDGAIRVLLWK